MVNEDAKLKDFLKENNLDYVYDGGKYWFDTKKISWMLVNHINEDTWGVFIWKKSDGTACGSYRQYFNVMLAEIKRDL